MIKMSSNKSPNATKETKKRKDSDKESPSTASPHSLDHHPENQQFQRREELWTNNYQQEKIADLNQIIDLVQTEQQEAKYKFDKIIEFLSLQVAKNHEENKKLEEEVKCLKKQVEECNQDITVIESLVRPERNEKYRERSKLIDSSTDKTLSRNNSKSRNKRTLMNNRSNPRIGNSKPTLSKLFKANFHPKNAF